MADVALEGAGFWLPTEFFADDDVDFLKGQENLGKPDPDSDFCFPTEFPYDFHSGNREHVEAASWVMTTSPRSTLGNWSSGSTGGSSSESPNRALPASAPLAGGSDAVVHLICRAAGQVAKLKLNSGDGLRPARNLGLVGSPRIPAQIYSSTRNTSPPIFQLARDPLLTARYESPGDGMWYGPKKQVYNCRRGKTDDGRVLGQAARPVKQNPTRNIGSGNRAVLFGGSSVAKRECTGTGVFLPRIYWSSNENSCNAYSSESHRKPVYPTSLLQERNFENMKDALAQPLPRPQPRFDGGFVSDYDVQMARRNSIMFQHQKSILSKKLAIGRECYHPQGWSW